MLAALLLSAVAAVEPVAAAPFNLRAAFQGRKTVQVARYVSQDGDVGFVLDRTGPQTLLRFDSSPELWALSHQPGARGDVMYKNDAGELVLRATKLGGMTLFTPLRPGGVAVAFAGPAPPLRAEPLVTEASFGRWLAQESKRASRAAQRLVYFEALDVTPQSMPVIADAATVTAEAFSDLAKDPQKRSLLGRISKVAFVAGRKPEAHLAQDVLTVTVVPPGPPTRHPDPPGRPSSRRIVFSFER